MKQKGQERIKMHLKIPPHGDTKTTLPKSPKAQTINCFRDLLTFSIISLDKTKNRSFKRKKVKSGLEFFFPYPLEFSFWVKTPNHETRFTLRGRTQNLSISVIDGSKCSPNFKQVPTYFGFLPIWKPT